MLGALIAISANCSTLRRTHSNPPPAPHKLQTRVGQCVNVCVCVFRESARVWRWHAARIKCVRFQCELVDVRKYNA